MPWNVNKDGSWRVAPEEEQGPPSFVINSDDGTLWIGPEWTPLARATSASLGPDWKPMGYLSEDGLTASHSPHVQWGEPTLPTTAAKQASLVELQEVVNRAIKEQYQREQASAFYRPVDTTRSHEFQVSFNMLDMDDQLRELFLGEHPLPEPDGVSAAILGLPCSNHDYHRAWQERNYEMTEAEFARQYGAYRQRYAAGVDYISGPPSIPDGLRPW